MRITLYTILAIGLLVSISCNSSDTSNSKTDATNQTTPQRFPLKTVDETILFITKNFNEPTETLWIANSLNDKAGINMAIIMDSILKAGYLPDGSEAKEGYRIHKYKKSDVR